MTTRVKTTVHPAAGRIVLREIRGSDVTSAGIILVNDIKREGHLGEVVAVSEPWSASNGDTIHSDFKVGDVVAFGRYTGTDLDLDGGRTRFIVMMEKDILCTIVTEDLPAEATPDA